MDNMITKIIIFKAFHAIANNGAIYNCKTRVSQIGTKPKGLLVDLCVAKSLDSKPLFRRP